MDLLHALAVPGKPKHKRGSRRRPVRQKPGPTQYAIRCALEELSVLHHSIEHGQLFDYLEHITPHCAQLALGYTARKRILPPGCRMTATHFEFS